MLVQMFLKVRMGCNLKVLEQRPGITGLVVIGTEHLGRHGFPEAAAAGNTAEASLGEKRCVDNSDKPGLIHIFTVPRGLESGIPDIDKCSHNAHYMKRRCKLRIIFGKALEPGEKRRKVPFKRSIKGNDEEKSGVYNSIRYR